MKLFKRIKLWLDIMHANHQAAHWHSMAYATHDLAEGTEALKMQLVWQRQAERARRKLFVLLTN